MVSCGDHVHPKVKELLGNLWSQPKAARRVLSIRDAQIHRVFFQQPSQMLTHHCPPRTPKNVSNEQYSQSNLRFFN
jgi:hypothetical protein